MFKKSKRSFRKRVRRSDSDDDESSNANKLEEKHEQSTPDLKVSVVHENGDKNEKASTEDDGVSKLRTDTKTKLSFHHADDDEVEGELKLDAFGFNYNFLFDCFDRCFCCQKICLQ